MLRKKNQKQVRRESEGREEEVRMLRKEEERPGMTDGGKDGKEEGGKEIKDYKTARVMVIPFVLG